MLEPLSNVGVGRVYIVDSLEQRDSRDPVAHVGGGDAPPVAVLQRQIGGCGRHGCRRLRGGHGRSGLGIACGHGLGGCLRGDRCRGAHGNGGCRGFGGRGTLLALAVEEQPTQRDKDQRDNHESSQTQGPAAWAARRGFAETAVVATVIVPAIVPTIVPTWSGANWTKAGGCRSRSGCRGQGRRVG